VDLRTLLGGFLAWVLYPLWLLAGAGDYLSHRFTRIEQTSGHHESWLHVAQFATLAIIFGCAVLFEITLGIFAVMALAVIAHTALSLWDVSYTLGRRHISAFEQHVHGFMDVIPFMAVCLLALMYWDTLAVPDANWPMLRWKDNPLTTPQIALLLGSFFVLAGVPVAEEWLRTRRAQGDERQRIGAEYRPIESEVMTPRPARQHR
jgi:hypothetical protein